MFYQASRLFHRSLIKFLSGKQDISVNIANEIAGFINCNISVDKSLMILTALIVRMQVGALFAVEKIKPKIDKLTPSSILKGLKRMLNPFDPKNLMEMSKSILKMINTSRSNLTLVRRCSYIPMPSRSF